MDSILLGLVLGLIHGKHHDHDDTDATPPAPSLTEVWRAGQQQRQERSARIERWSASLPLARFSLNPRVREMARERRAHHG